MDRQSLEEFLERGWDNGAQLFYNDNIYWTDCSIEKSIYKVTVFKAPAIRTSDKTYALVKSENKPNKFELVFKKEEKDNASAKLALLEAPIFEGKSFWQVEKELDWLEL